MSIVVRVALAASLAASLVPGALAQAPEKKTQAAPASRPPARSPARDPVVATVNGEEIHFSDVAMYLGRFSIPPGEETEAYEKSLDIAISTRVLIKFLQD